VFLWFNCFILVITQLWSSDPFSFTSPPTGQLLFRIPSCTSVQSPQLYFCSESPAILLFIVPSYTSVQSPQIYFCSESPAILLFRVPNYTSVQSPQLYFCCWGSHIPLHKKDLFLLILEDDVLLLKLVLMQYITIPPAAYSALERHTDETPTVKPDNFRNERLSNRTRPNLSYNFYIGKMTICCCKTDSSFVSFLNLKEL
jgi:hypothetical protein